MKIIIYWLTLIVILPFLYLFWWKKKWRLVIGISIIATLTIGFFAPGEIVYSILTNQIEKEQKNKIKKFDESLKKVSEQKIDEENPKEKIEQAKEIIEFRKEIKKREKLLIENQIIPLHEDVWRRGNITLNNLRREWIKKWSKEKFLSTLLFCGKEFNDKLEKGNYHWFEEEKWKKKIDTKNIIDFANYQNSKVIKEKFLSILENEERKRFVFPTSLSIVWFKNIDKIANHDFLTEIFNVEKTDSLINEKNINLLKFIFIFTTSNSRPKISENLLAKLRRVETWEKYSIIIFLVTGGLEVIIFLFLIRNKKNSKNKMVKIFDY